MRDKSIRSGRGPGRAHRRRGAGAVPLMEALEGREYLSAVLPLVPMISVATMAQTAEGRPAGAFTFTRLGSVAAALDVTIALWGSAAAGSDYVPLATEVHFAAGKSTAVVAVTPLMDALAEGRETVFVAVVGSDLGQAYTINPARAMAVVAIDDAASTFSVSVSKATASEITGSAGQFTITRTGGNLAKFDTVHFTLDGLAAAGVNYRVLTSAMVSFDAASGTGTAVFAPGKTSVNVAFVPLNDLVANSPRLTVRLTAKADTSYSVNFLRASAIVAIADAAATISVTPTLSRASEVKGATTGKGAFTLVRTGGNLNTWLVVNFDLWGTATEGTDYAAVAHTAIFAPGKTSVVVPVIPVDDTALEGPEAVILTVLADGGNSYFINGARGAAGLAIADDVRNAVAAPAVGNGQGGWTVVTASSDTQIVYVSSSSGSDGNDGLSAAAPVRTIAHAESLFTKGHPVWLLLKAGDTWNEVVGEWEWSGESAAHPSLVSSYGTGARPVLKTGTESGIAMYGGTGVPATLDYIDIIGIDFYASQRDPNSADFSQAAAAELTTGVAAGHGGTGLLIEDCRFRYYGLGINVAGLDGPWSNVTIRRNEVLDSYSSTEEVHSQGILVSETHTLLVEENVVDHNGWNTSPLLPGAVASVFNHNVYLQFTNSDVTFRNNISAEASSHGVQARNGGMITGNLLVDDPIGMLVGSSQLAFASQVTANVILNGRDIMGAPTLQRGWGVTINDTPATLFQGNVIANNDSTGEAISVDGGTQNVISGNVIYHWGAIEDNTGVAAVAGGQVDSGDLADPTRDLGSYMASLGQGSTTAAFLAAARGQSKNNWNPLFMAQAVNAYIRAGFGPGTVTGVKVLAAGTTAADVTWDGISDALGYVIQRSMDGVNGWVQVAVPGVGLTTYRNTLLASGTRYYYRVVAFNGVGYSPAASVVNLLLG